MTCGATQRITLRGRYRCTRRIGSGEAGFQGYGISPSATNIPRPAGLSMLSQWQPLLLARAKPDWVNSIRCWPKKTRNHIDCFGLHGLVSSRLSNLPQSHFFLTMQGAKLSEMKQTAWGVMISGEKQTFTRPLTLHSASRGGNYTLSCA